MRENYRILTKKMLDFILKFFKVEIDIYRVSHRARFLKYSILTQFIAIYRLIYKVSQNTNLTIISHIRNND